MSRTSVLLLTGLITALCTSGTAFAQGGSKEDVWNPSVTTLAQLPQYCWAQYRKEYREQTGTKSPVDLCGVQMNHFCPGLIYMLNARKPSHTRGTRADFARKAMGQFDYTVRGMPAGCPIAADVHTARSQAEILMKILK